MKYRLDPRQYFYTVINFEYFQGFLLLSREGEYLSLSEAGKRTKL